MNKEQQDKLWNELSDESRKSIIQEYNELSDDLDIELWRSSEIEFLFGSHNLNPNPMTYEDIIREIDKNSYISPLNGEVYSSKEQLIKENAIHKLLNVAKYLNGDWKPDLSDENAKFYTLGIDSRDNSIKIIEVRPYYMFTTEIVSFEEKELAEKTLQILGEETIRLALSNDY